MPARARLQQECFEFELLPQSDRRKATILRALTRRAVNRITAPPAKPAGAPRRLDACARVSRCAAAASGHHFPFWKGLPVTLWRIAFSQRLFS
jgi:hypothetical protein